MPAHTPGPWKMEEYDAAMGGKRYEVSALPDGKWVRVTQPMESEANARLIAAAPALLEALEALVNRVDRAGGLGEYTGGPAFAMTKARTAIAQAKGETV